MPLFCTRAMNLPPDGVSRGLSAAQPAAQTPPATEHVNTLAAVFDRNLTFTRQTGVARVANAIRATVLLLYRRYAIAPAANSPMADRTAMLVLVARC